jgi:hypothetical protein
MEYIDVVKRVLIIVKVFLLYLKQVIWGHTETVSEMWSDTVFFVVVGHLQGNASHHRKIGLERGIEQDVLRYWENGAINACKRQDWRSEV